MTDTTTTPTLDRSEHPDVVGPLAAVSRPGSATPPPYRPAGASAPVQGRRTLEAWRRHPAVVEGRHIVRVRAAELERRRARRRSRREWAGIVVVWGLLAVVLMAVGMVVAVRYGSLPGDALSRVQAARGMVSGRDPHPEAIGFVWGPFPTLFEVPFAALGSRWPWFTGSGVAAVAVSAMALSAMSLQLHGWGRDLGAPRWCSVAVVVVTLAHPLVWTAGINGMSEAIWFLFLVIAGRRLTRWLDTDDVVSLAIAGVALGLAYLARFETLAAIGAATCLVGVVSFRWSPVDALVPPEHRLARGAGAPILERPRVRAALLDATLLAFPATAAVATWSLVCWAIVGEPFPQISSEYGNAAIVRAAAGSIEAIVGDASPVGRLWFFTRQSVTAAAAVALLGAVAIWLGGRTAWRAGVAAAVLGSPLAIQAVLSLQGSTFPWFRYVASGVLLAAALLLVIGGDVGQGRAPRWVLPACILLLVPSIVASTVAVSSGELGSFDDSKVVAAVVAAARGEQPDPAQSASARGAEVADYIDQIDDIEPGAVLTDTSSTFAVVAASPRPELYVVPSDRDFEQIVADPQQFGVRYLLLRGPASAGDALRARFPQLWEGDPELAQTVATWGSEGSEAGNYRLLRVVDPEGEPRARPDLSEDGGA